MFFFLLKFLESTICSFFFLSLSNFYSYVFLVYVMVTVTHFTLSLVFVLSSIDLYQLQDSSGLAMNSYIFWNFITHLGRICSLI